jgi:hypothetical protein
LAGLQKSQAMISKKALSSIDAVLRNQLGTIGETRFPHFTHLFPEDQEIKVA